MQPEPIYKKETINPPSYQLRYGWTGWLSDTSFDELPDDVEKAWRKTLEKDGIRVLDLDADNEKIQCISSIVPGVSPVTFTTRIKGRLQYALKKLAGPVTFSRKVSMRTIGETRNAIVTCYIQNQVRESDYADPDYRKMLKTYTENAGDVDLSEPQKTRSGRYWYNLHIVLVTRDRFRMRKEHNFQITQEGIEKIAEKHDYKISTYSIMPDHLHLALRGNIQMSPEDIALSFLNNLAFLHDQNAIWEHSYYAGTFGDYDMNLVR